MISKKWRDKAQLKYLVDKGFLHNGHEWLLLESSNMD